jgi:hypothetical protein
MKCLIAATLLLSACSLWADQVTLTNGDRVTGLILRSDTKNLVLKTEGVSYTLNLNKKTFVSGSVDLESDQFQDLDLRFTPAGGGGYHAIATMPTQLDLRVGMAANREFFSTGLNRTSAELLVDDDSVHKFSASRVEQKLDIFTNLSDTGAYRVNFDIPGVKAIRKWFSWQVIISDRVLSNPVSG